MKCEDATAREFLFALFSMIKGKRVNYYYGVTTIIEMMDFKRKQRMEQRNANRNL